MEGHRTRCWFLALAGVLAVSGTSCRWLVPAQQEIFAPTLPPAPSMDQIMAVVNGNSRQIQSLAANQATLSGQGFPSLRTTVHFERPRRLRLRAGTAMLGPEIDLGSNDELFWIWIRRNEPAATLFGRHAQFAQSPIRRTLPVDPDWLAEAVGITEIDPSLNPQGPTPLSGGRYEIRTTLQTPDGPTTKIVIVDGSRGLVLEQNVFDPNGQLVASAIARSHRRDPRTALITPRVIDIRVPRAGLAMQLDLGAVEVNRLGGDTSELWSMPRHEGYPMVDLCDPNVRFSADDPPR